MVDSWLDRFDIVYTTPKLDVEPASAMARQRFGLVVQKARLGACNDLVVLLDGEDLPSVVHAAFFADAMRETGFSAVGAEGNLDAFIAVCGVAGADPSLAYFALLNSHDSLLLGSSRSPRLPPPRPLGSYLDF